MSHCRYPRVTISRTLHHHNRTVRHPDAPLAHIATRVRYVHPVHHVILVSVDVLIAQATDIVHLRHLCSTILVLLHIPGILMHKIVHKTVRHIRINPLRLFVAHSVLHAPRCRTASRACIRVRTCATLLLHVLSPILCIAQICDAPVHQRVYLLHTSLHAIVVEVHPCHVCSRRTTRYAGTQFCANHRAARHTTKVLVVGHPVRLHVFNLLAVTQHHLVKLSSV